MSTHTQIKELSSALLALHRYLLMTEAKIIENEGGRKLSPYELLGLSLNDPRLAWLRQISTRIVEIDTLLDEVEKPDHSTSTRLADEISGLFSVGGNEVFWGKYSGYLSHDTEVILKHAELKSILDNLRRSSEN